MNVTTVYREGGKKNSITYERIHCSEFNDDILAKYVKVDKHTRQSSKRGYTNDIQRDIKVWQYKYGKYAQSALEVHMSFDIETTRVAENKSFMYVWNVGLFDTVIWGETWEEFIQLLANIKSILQYKDTHRVLVFVANLGYEWQFMREHLNVTHCFFKALRQPVEIEHDSFFIFKEALSWGKSLAQLAKDYTDIPKLKGDLDYSVYRTSPREFTNDREWAYCDFDVLILTRFARWFFAEYLHQHSKPVTVTQALYNRIKQRQKDTREDTPTAEDFPATYSEYNTLVNYVYRGGYVHANCECVGQVINNLWSVDFTSSYPSVILTQLFPWRFYTVEPSKLDIARFNFDTVHYAFYGLFIFKGIQRTTSHSIESESKCVYTKDVVLDNGRIVRGDIAVWLTEQDFMSYREFYKWDSCECKKLYVSKKRKLPDYLVAEMCELYTAKAVKKAKHEPYSIEKSYVNTTYGLCVKKLITEEIEMQEGAPVTVSKNVADEYDKYRQKSLLLPQFGCWVSAYARRFLLSNVYQLETAGNKVFYCDTDSIKFSGYSGMRVINEYNKAKQAEVRAICEERGLTLDIFWDLGSFDVEYKKGIQHFKTLGAKRYIYEYSEGGKIHRCATVAGLPKKVYPALYGNSYTAFYENFENGLTVRGCKLAPKYNDSEPFSVYRCGRNETVWTCTTLNETDFSLSMDTEWLSYLQDVVFGKSAVRNV